MYPVSQDFLQKIRADERQVFAKLQVDYTSPFLDQSISVEANETANASFPSQTADAVAEPFAKIASLDGSWVLDGTYALAPTPEESETKQMGWWGKQLAGTGGAFTTPYPTLTVSFFPRPITKLQAVGDSKREEWPVDFNIKLYDGNNTLLHTETVTGNTQIAWSKTLAEPITQVEKMTLEITKWSHAGRQAKILEFFTSIQEVYEGDDILLVHLLEEREVSQGSLPVGNISANEIDIRLNNETRKFDAGNKQSPLYQTLKANRRIKAWLGTEAENNYTDKPPTFTRNSIAYKSDGTHVAANQPRFEQGRFGKAIMVEEGTTNALSYAFTSDTNLLQYFTDLYSGSSVTIDTTQTPPVSGQKVVKHYAAVNDSYIQAIDANGVYYGTASTAKLAVTGGSYVTFSIWAKGQNGGEQIQIFIFDYASDTGGFKSIKYQTFTVTNTWQRYIVTVQTASDAVRAWARVDNNLAGQTVYWCAPQLENKAYVTSFTPSTRSPETLTIPTAGVLNPQEGTVEFWLKPLSGFFNNNVGGDGYNRVLGHSTAVNINELHVSRITGTNKLAFSISNSSGEWAAGGWAACQTTTNFEINNFYHIAVKWSQSQGKFSIFVNGIKEDEAVYDKFPTIVNPLYIGSHQHYSARRGNIIIDDLRISRRARSNGEILAAYASGQPLPVDEWTTYKLTFNGSIYPVEKVWIPLGTFWSGDWHVPEDEVYAATTGRDRLELLRKSTYSTSQVQMNKTLYDLARNILQDAGLTEEEYYIDTELKQFPVPYAWFEPQSHREALRKVAEACLGQVYCDRDGIIRVEGPSYLASKTTADLTITQDDYFRKDNPVKWGQIANYIEAETQPLRPDVSQEVYRSNEPISITAGQTKTITAYYNHTPCIEATATLENAVSGAQITKATYYAWGADITVTSTNTGTFELVINAKPLKVLNKEKAIAQDEESITDNGKLRYVFPANPLVQTREVAQKIADTLLAYFKNPRRDVEVEWRGNPALLLGDKVAVVDKDEENEYFVTRQELEYTGALRARMSGRRA